MTIGVPEPLSKDHDVGQFDSGVPALDDWLRRRAYKNQVADASRTFVACREGTVIGYYALASGGVATTAAPGRFRRNMPEPVPIVVLGRLAVDRRHQGIGLGRALFVDGARRVIHAADTIGIRGILVRAISEDAKAFYQAIGFDASPLDPMTLMIALADLRSSL
ncbi:GNAT family acetyltransferase [Methylobacterium sp. Leaf399]|uniref:GNAT family N-acetyltransferase n=1 Tax=Methylobacterium sp. Leaf399 TaxID=1736364 RepID=UPI0006F7C7C4|nr:GNAT family N-acetyltransferase [Methylobacterium sp. Leaf399]KQT07488.1 GNAT family acetyltransferase [Methylobacterium sp. Leaf399]